MFKAGLTTGCQEPQEAEQNSDIDDVINPSFDRKYVRDCGQQYDTNGVADEQSGPDGRVDVLIQVDCSKEFGCILSFVLQLLALLDAGGRVHVDDDDEAVPRRRLRQTGVNLCSHVDQKLMYLIKGRQA